MAKRYAIFTGYGSPSRFDTIDICKSRASRASAERWYRVKVDEAEYRHTEFKAVHVVLLEIDEEDLSSIINKPTFVLEWVKRRDRP